MTKPNLRKNCTESEELKKRFCNIMFFEVLGSFVQTPFRLLAISPTQENIPGEVKGEITK
jgi:hypothetical protein